MDDTRATGGRGPVTVWARLEEPLSRWLWLVKWVLLIPHLVVLVFLWLAYLLVTVVAFFAILFTARYPRGLFEFNTGVIRWTWRVSAYGYGLLSTDRYPPFTLAPVADYPARVDVEYPERLSRGLIFVKWLLAIPHLLILGALAGTVYMGDRDDREWNSPGLLALGVAFAAIALLFTARYPRGLFDLLMGGHRWGLRVLVYVTLLSDTYPPFRLDQGADEPPASANVAPAPDSGAP